MRPEQYIDEPPDADEMEYDRDANPGEGQQNFKETQYNIPDDRRVHYDPDIDRRNYDFDHKLSKTGRIAKLMKKRSRKIRFKSVLDSGAYGSTLKNHYQKTVHEEK